MKSIKLKNPTCIAKMIIFLAFSVDFPIPAFHFYFPRVLHSHQFKTSAN